MCDPSYLKRPNIGAPLSVKFVKRKGAGSKITVILGLVPTMTKLVDVLPY